MARHLLSARQVQVARKGDNQAGDGLILRVKERLLGLPLHGAEQPQAA
jgi:hypothetical protein